MTVEVIAVGGYEEVGKNMTAVKIGEDVIIFDMESTWIELAYTKTLILTECIVWT